MHNEVSVIACSLCVMEGTMNVYDVIVVLGVIECKMISKSNLVVLSVVVIDVIDCTV